jgi:hypothetical protein
VALCLGAAPAASADVPPGFDLFETDPSSTVFSFREEFTIPPNFFDQGSAAFQGDVHFGGLPLNTFQGRDVGDADTVVRRPQPAILAPPFPRESSIPIELVALSLQSVAPIQVQTSSGLQLWDVFATQSPSTSSQGQMDITQTSERGGTFNSLFQVFPRFTFTRLSDGQTRTIDLGQNPSPQTRVNLILAAQNVPWRDGCVPPALAVPGLNDGFCPALTPNPSKQLNVEQARLARHGVYPAQPRLEHFKCYATRLIGRFRRRRVSLVDQFGNAGARLVGQRGLCAPVRKNRERFGNRRAHLQCYATRRSPVFQARTVAVRNQFGMATLRVSSPTALCAPSVKSPVRRRRPRGLAPAARIDHFTCYRARSTAAPLRRRVNLAGQFGRERVRVLRPVNLCAPAGKNGAAVLHPVQHLVCYTIRDLGRRRFRPRAVRVTNQFGRRVVAVLSPALLCVPSLKLA